MLKISAPQNKKNQITKNCEGKDRIDKNYIFFVKMKNSKINELFKKHKLPSY
jgi:hypothetical protein